METAKKAYAREEVLAGAKLGQATAKIEAEAEKQKRAILGTATPGDVGSTETPVSFFAETIFRLVSRLSSYRAD